MKLSIECTIFSFRYQLFGFQFHFGHIHILHIHFRNLFDDHNENVFDILHNDRHMHRIRYHIVAKKHFIQG